MGKTSSSSMKKKRSKSTAQGRARKRSKTKGIKSKKHRLRDDSVSYSDVDSRSSVSVSSSGPEDSYRRRRSRFHIRKGVKGSKKRARARSTSSEDSSRVRRQKGSKRNDDSEVRKKTHEKKMKKKKAARRDASISSRSSGSWSCSTCQGPCSSSDDSEYERHRGRSKRRENNKRKLEKIKSGTKRRRYRTRSSSRGRHNGSTDHLSEEKMACVNTSQRLRSVVTFTKGDEEGRELDKDEHKEEMIYDHDDYPSCRSNDSNDVGNKRESAYQLHVTYEKDRPIEDEKRDDDPVSNVKATKVTEISEGGEDQCARSKLGDHMVGTNDAIIEKKNKISGAVDAVNGDDLESVLRKKALENLRRFRGGSGGFHATAKGPLKDKHDTIVKPMSTARAELGQIKSPEDDGVRVVPGDSSHSLQNYEKIPDAENDGNEFGSAKNNAHPPDQVAIASRERVSITVGSGINKPRLVTSALSQALSNATTSPMEATASRESNQGELVTGSSVGKSASQTAHSVTPPAPASNFIGDKVKNASGSNSSEPPSCHASAAEDIGSNKLQDEGKEGSQLEQKKMSVMRGGELVQVSYKVYIPKKTPALARRQLKR